MTSLASSPDPGEENLGKPLPIKLSRIERYVGQPRTWFDPNGIEGLARSLQKNGQNTPVLVCPKPGGGGFILLGGERRWRAFHLIKEWTGQEPTVDAHVKHVDPKDFFRKAVLDNLYREDLIPLDTAAALHRLHNEDGETIAALAELIGKSTSYVTNYLKLHTLPDKVKELMHPSLPKDKQLTVTSAIDIACGVPASADDLRIQLAQEAVDRNFSIAETQQLIVLRTGTAGFRVGGYHRKPSDDYKVFATFIGRTRKKLIELRALDFDDLYARRDSDDRETDASLIDGMIRELDEVRKKLRKKPH